jgi:hypothetical protein
MSEVKRNRGVFESVFELKGFAVFRKVVFRCSFNFSVGSRKELSFEKKVAKCRSSGYFLLSSIGEANFAYMHPLYGVLSTCEIKKS